MPKFTEIISAVENCPIILTAPHGGVEIPKELRQKTWLSEEALLGTSDLGTDKLIALDCRFHGLCARYARSAVDLNRAPHQMDPKLVDSVPNSNDPYVRAGYGVIPRFAADKCKIWPDAFSLFEAKAMVEKYHKPFHDKLEAWTRDLYAQFGWVLILDIHTAPARSMAGADIVLGNCHGLSCEPKISFALETIFKRYFDKIAMNTPFAGGYITRHYGKPAKHIHVVQVEISRALIEDEFRQCKKEFLKDWSVILNDISEYFFESEPSRFAAE